MRIDRLLSVAHLLASCLVGGRCPGCRGRSLRPLCSTCSAELRRTPTAPGAALQDEGIAGRVARRAKHGQWRAAPLVLVPVMLDRLGGAERLRGRIDVVSWVPADAGRRRRRGGHLPEQLARGLADGVGVPARSMLRRVHGRAQRGLDEQERARNVEGLFEARRGGREAGPEPGGGLVVLLLDDVRTTGATLAEATRLLELRGCRVIAYALVGVPRRDGTRPHVAPRSGVTDSYGETRTMRGKPAHERALECR